MKIGEEALPAAGVDGQTTGVRTILIVVGDVRAHPGSAIGEIATRAGLPQSAVSGAVARLREAGAIVTDPDPRDRRRLLIQPASEPSGRVEAVKSTSIETALAKALGTAGNPPRVAEIIALLEDLAQDLTPEALARLRS
ncbi:MarR family transcriptional regulator [Planomonospora algeriensis]